MVARARRPLRVVFLGPTPPPVMGPSIATAIVLSQAPPEDIDLFHLDTADRRPLSTLGRIDFGNLWQAFRMYMGLLWLVIVKRPHLVYIPISQTPIGYLRDSLLIVLAWLFRRRIALHLRGGGFRDFYAGCGRLLRWWVRWTLRRTHGVIVLGDCLRGLFTRFVPAEKILVVPNGEDFPEFADDESRNGRPPRHVVFLGNMFPEKGVADLLHAIPLVLAKNPETRFTLAGSWLCEDFRQWATDFVRERGVADRVRFLGPVNREEKTRLLKEADLFCFPSTREGHPWVIVEALAAGLPIVSCDSGCIRECVFDGENGHLVPLRDPEAIASVLSDLLGDPERLRRMAAASRSLYERSFTRADFRGRLFEALRRAGGRAGTCA